MPAPMCYNHAVGAPARSDALAEAYRSGHNEAVLKTVWVQAHGGSNPSASATAKRTGSARPFCCGGGGDRGANGAAERQRKRNDRTRLFYRSSKNYRRRRFGGARTRPRKKRCLIRATLSPALHLKRNAPFYLHFPFSQSLPYGEYPATFFIKQPTHAPSFLPRRRRSIITNPCGAN